MEDGGFFERKGVTKTFSNEYNFARLFFQGLHVAEFTGFKVLIDG